MALAMTDNSLAHLDSPQGRRLAYRRRTGASPALLFLPGYASDMDGAKAVALDSFAAERGLAMVRFDYSGTGSSEGAFEEGTLQRWLEESLLVLDRLTHGPVIVAGSSMGGWIALHLAIRRPERVQALVGIAAAPDFTDWGFTDEQKATLERNGRLTRGEQLTTLAFWQTGEALKLLGSEMAIDCPVRLVHGERDEDVPSSVPAILMGRLRSADVQLKLIKNGGHRLSEPHEIAAILNTVAELLEPK
jgi:pimeloyl-ACP methyl ester carboxylesterase